MKYTARNIDELNFEEAKDLLKEWRDNKIRASEDVVDIWKTILELHINSLGSEKFDIIEQVFTASLDVGYYNLSEKLLAILSKQFPDSEKVLCLRSMHLQATELYPAALRLIESVIAKNPADVFARKRKISIIKDMGRISDAVKELVEYLKTFPFDLEGWQQLSNFYINENEFQKAAHCVETILLHNPNDHLWLQRYADIKYTIGGYENYELARIYYLCSLKVNKKNLRALYGLNLACNNLLNATKITAVKKKLLIKYINWSTKKINYIYKNGDKNITEKQLKNLMSSLKL